MSSHEPFLELLEAVTPIVSVVAGYRQECLAQGFSETASEQMATEFHRLLIVHAMQQAAPA